MTRRQEDATCADGYAGGKKLSVNPGNGLHRTAEKESMRNDAAAVAVPESHQLLKSHGSITQRKRDSSRLPKLRISSYFLCFFFFNFYIYVVASSFLFYT